MIAIESFRINSKALKKDNRYRVFHSKTPVFSWRVLSSGKNLYQTACKVKVTCDQEVFWDSGWCENRNQSIGYQGKPLPVEKRICFEVSVRDNSGQESEPKEDYFFLSDLPAYPLNWIASQKDEKGKTLYFRKDFYIDKEITGALLYVSGLGYHHATLNGQPLDSSLLEPPVSDYTKTVYYVCLPELESFLKPGKNTLAIEVGEGWRRNEGSYIDGLTDRKIGFFGLPQLSAVLKITYTDGETETICTDESWLCGQGGIVYNHLFNGETYDAGCSIPGWNLPESSPEGFAPAKAVSSPGGTPLVTELEPIREQELYSPKTIWPAEDGFLVDFGQNMAGVIRLRLPAGMTEGQRITIEHGEFLNPDGSLHTANLRGALCRDCYIASGDERDLKVWQPRFVYHGFRYAKITGLPLLRKEDLTAVSFYSDVQTGSFFTCGSALVNAIEKLSLQTEKANIHGILTDCPQRDERMGWMNDATVRFEETPYHFDIGRLFPKVLADLLDCQGKDGSITCTAPYVYGSRPADPVCSSFLVAGLQALLFTDNRSAIADAYEGFARWQECLAAHAESLIVNYSHYGDWAGPVYACVNGDHDINAVHSLYTPGEFMSTGYFYYNAKLLSRFADLLNKPEDRLYYEKMADSIRQAMLKKWWDPSTGRMATGSQGCQSFALWLGILPEEGKALAAKVLHDDLVSRDYKITTGNLCTRYLYDALSENGYLEDAWKLITREEYPSYGYMIQNGATTVWERFEFKAEPDMNSHNHPMYGTVSYWFYAYLAGIRPVTGGFEQAIIKPYFPKELLSVSAQVDTVKGPLSVRWVRQWGKLSLFVSVPFGMTCTVYFNGKAETVGSGQWSFSIDE